MNNLTSTLVVLVVTGVLYFRERTLFVKAQASNQRSGEELSRFDEQLSGLEEHRAELERRIAEFRDQLLASEEAEARARASALQSIVPPNPSRNGGWPKDASYFYLPKHDLPFVGHVVFHTPPPQTNKIGNNINIVTSGSSDTWATGLSDDDITLFGMTAAEREGMDAAHQGLWRKLRQLGLSKVERVAPEKGWGIPVVSEYHIPRLSDEASAVLAELKPTFRQILGTPRADYFVDGAAGAAISNAFQSAAQNEYFIVFGPERTPEGEVQSQVSYSSGSGSFGGGIVLKKHPYLRGFFQDGLPNPNP